MALPKATYHSDCRIVQLPTTGDCRIISRYTKYTDAHAVTKKLLTNFFGTIEHFLGSVPFSSFLEIGCGEGILMHHLRGQLTGKNVTGIDLDEEAIVTAKQNNPSAQFSVGSVYELPFADDTFDVVMCCEVMEHLENPTAALQEISRVSKRFCILSVPNEPLWRILNIIRGKYFHDLGNTPGHINHWSAGTFYALLQKHFTVREIAKPVPWIAALCEKKA